MPGTETFFFFLRQSRFKRMETRSFPLGGGVTWIYEQGGFCSSLLVDKRGRSHQEKFTEEETIELTDQCCALLHPSTTHFS